MKRVKAKGERGSGYQADGYDDAKAGKEPKMLDDGSRGKAHAYMRGYRRGLRHVRLLTPNAEVSR